MRTLLIFIALALIVMIGRQLLRKPHISTRTPAKTGQMVRCAHCGMYVPQHEACMQDGVSYCSAEHRTAARGTHDV
ncbi:MAG: PP0621 family protein [Pseudomonadota bacterium]